MDSFSLCLVLIVTLPYLSVCVMLSVAAFFRMGFYNPFCGFFVQHGHKETKSVLCGYTEFNTKSIKGADRAI